MRKVPTFLQLLLTSDDVDSAEYRAAVAQLERQPHLAPLLEQLAIGDTKWWEEAKDVYAQQGLPTGDQPESQLVTIEIESTLSQDVPVECEQVSLDFLDPPTHPELLGRLDRYEIERVLGTGGMGVVLRAFDTDLHRVVAIKVLAAHLANNGSARRRFAREAQAAAAVVHPHVIPIFNVESDAKIPYIVMHYVAGQSLQRRVDIDGPLPVLDALRIAQQTAAGLSAAHGQGLVHRDVKPANILLEEKIDRVLLSDFGLARAVDDASLTRTGIVAGTPHYMSPEQAHGESIDHRSDLFSLGSVLYFTLAGHPPFRASSAMAVLHRICQHPHRPLIEVNRDVPIEVSQLVDRLLSKRAEDRPASSEEVERQLGELLVSLQQRGLSIQSESQSLVTPHAVSQSNRLFAMDLKTVAVVVMAACMLLATIMAFPAWMRGWQSSAHDLGVSNSGSASSSELSQKESATEPVNAMEILHVDQVQALIAAEKEFSQWTELDLRMFDSMRQIRQGVYLIEESNSANPLSSDEFYEQTRAMAEAIRVLQQNLEN